MKTEEERAKAFNRKLAERYRAEGKELEWFEALYSKAKENEAGLPWAERKVNRFLEKWFKEHPPSFRGKAMVTGCGLGDDAEYLASLGFQVTAFDISATAIDWCHERFPGSPVHYAVGDLLSPQKNWCEDFDFVVESYTLQMLSEAKRCQGLVGLSRLVKPGGRLLIICRGREAEEAPGLMPWHLSKEELDSVLSQAFTEVLFEDFYDEESSPVRRFILEYEKVSIDKA